MDININKNFYFKALENEKELRETILDMVLNEKPEKIIYKGNPTLIKYKVLRKIILKKNTTMEPDMIRGEYSKLLDLVKTDYCIIYKK